MIKLKILETLLNFLYISPNDLKVKRKVIKAYCSIVLAENSFQAIKNLGKLFQCSKKAMLFISDVLKISAS